MMDDKKSKEIQREWKKVEQEEMKDGEHQLELQESYVADEAYEESED